MKGYLTKWPFYFSSLKILICGSKWCQNRKDRRTYRINCSFTYLTMPPIPKTSLNSSEPKCHDNKLRRSFIFYRLLYSYSLICRKEKRK